MRRAVASVLVLAACGGRTSSHGASNSSSGPQPCAVTTSGAPFCYPLPDGFSNRSADNDYAYGWKWRTLVSIGPHDLIEVIAHPVQTDLDTMSDLDALNFAENLAVREDAPGVVTASTLTNDTVDGARAFRQDVTYDSSITTHNYDVLRGHAVVNISCQFTAQNEPTVTAACDGVLASIHVLSS